MSQIDFLLKQREGLRNGAVEMEALANAARREEYLSTSNADRDSNMHTKRTGNENEIEKKVVNSELYSGTKEDLSMLGVQLDIAVIERMQSRLGSDVFMSAIKAAHTLRGNTISDKDANLRLRTRSSPNVESSMDFVQQSINDVNSSSNNSIVVDSTIRRENAKAWSLAKTPMGHLVDMSGSATWTNGQESVQEENDQTVSDIESQPEVQAEFTNYTARNRSLETESSLYGIHADHSLNPALTSALNSLPEVINAQNKNIISQSHPVQSYLIASETTEHASAIAHVRVSSNRDRDRDLNGMAETTSPGRAHLSQGRGPGGTGGARRLSANQKSAASSVPSSRGKNGVDSVASSSASKGENFHRLGVSPQPRRLFDVTVEEDPVIEAISLDADEDIQQREEGDDDSEAPSALLSYMLQRGIAKADINDEAYLAMPVWASADEGSLDVSQSVGESTAYSKMSVTSLPRSPVGSMLSFTSRPAAVSTANKSTQEDPDICFDEHMSLSLVPGRKELVLAAVGRLSPEKVSQAQPTMPPKAPSPNRRVTDSVLGTVEPRYEHEMNLLPPRTQRERVLRHGAVVQNCATLPASAIDRVDPACRAELDAMILELQYDYVANSEKFVRRLYDYPINAPKVNIKMVLQRRYAHGDFFKQGIMRCLVGGRGGPHKWDTPRTQEVIWNLHQLVYEIRRIPGELERRPCVDLWRFLRMLRTSDVLSAQWRIGSKKAVEEMNVTHSLHRKENGGTNVPIPKNAKRVHLLQRQVDKGSQNLQIGDSVASQNSRLHLIHTDATRYVSGLPHGRQPNEKLSQFCEVVVQEPVSGESSFRSDSHEFPKGATPQAVEAARRTRFHNTKPKMNNPAHPESSEGLRALLQPEIPSKPMATLDRAERRSSHGALQGTRTNFALKHTLDQEIKINSPKKDKGYRLNHELTSPGRKHSFLRHQLDSSTVASALHASSEDNVGRYRFGDIRRAVSPAEKKSSKSMFSEKELKEGNSTNEGRRYHELYERALFRQTPRGVNRGSEFLSMAAIRKHNNCGVAAILKPE